MNTKENTKLGIETMTSFCVQNGEDDQLLNDCFDQVPALTFTSQKESAEEANTHPRWG
jgi:hypothetical protein